MSFDLGNPKDYFQIAGRLVEFCPLKIGHIHDTWISWWVDSAEQSAYIHQKINHHILQNVDGLMGNITLILNHLRQKSESGGGEGDQIFSIIPTKDGSSYCKLNNGNYWRTYSFIQNTESHFVCEGQEMAYQAASCCGRFLKRLSDLNLNALTETIPNFTNARMRYAKFKQAVKDDTCARVAEARSEIDLALSNEALAYTLQNSLDNNEIPVRLAHNDLKLNNVLFNKGTSQAVSVVDLDTCMQGSFPYDFGDFIRNTCIEASEDETDLSKIELNIDFFKASSEGFLSELGDGLTETERKLLPLSPAVLALILGVRFLTDYLEGDVYFKTHRPRHNLGRAIAQFQVFKSIMCVQDSLLRLL